MHILYTGTCVCINVTLLKAQRILHFSASLKPFLNDNRQSLKMIAI